MQTMNQSLYSLYTRKIITREEALNRSPEADEMEMMLRQAK
jgi:Tfp pilus assembly ATPase PilU